MRRSRRIITLGLALAVTACAAGENTVQVTDNAFRPAQLTVPVGTVVYWIWNGQAPHDVSFGGGGSSPLQTTGQYERAFGTPGTYDYTCTVHPGMDGRIIVQ
jgi:plastocyanin